jgi:large subunit ribosomal protein L6
MSRIGKNPITIPKGVTVRVEDVRVLVSGPKGTLERDVPPQVTVRVEAGTVFVERVGDGRVARAMHGLVRTLVANMVLGVSEGFKKSLEITGVGYRAEVLGKNLKLQVGLSYDLLYPIPEGLSCTVEKQTLVHLAAADKELVGRAAADIRAVRPCEPYKGKGIKYVGERVRRKEGKTGS